MENVIDIVLDNITWVIFGIFMLSGLFGRSGGKKPTSSETAPQEMRTSAPDNRPLAERMVERFGIDLEELQGTPQSQPQPNPRAEKYASQGRRSTTIRNVQGQYPELFGGSGLFEDRPRDGFARDETKWGFDETEWGSTFEKNETQWGGGFPDRKNSEPRIEWPR